MKNRPVKNYPKFDTAFFPSLKKKKNTKIKDKTSKTLPPKRKLCKDVIDRIVWKVFLLDDVF